MSKVSTRKTYIIKSSVCMCAQLLSHVRFFAIPWAVALYMQAPLSTGILEARILGWVAMPSSRGSSQASSPVLQTVSLPSELPGKLKFMSQKGHKFIKLKSSNLWPNNIPQFLRNEAPLTFVKESTTLAHRRAPGRSKQLS